MIRLMLLILLCLMVQFGYTQRLQRPLWTNSGSGSFIGLYGYGTAVSSDLSNSFIRELAWEPELTRQSRMSQSNLLKDRGNRVGGDYIMAIQGGIKIDSANTSLIFNFSDEGFGEVFFPKDAFDFVFMGNQPFAGDTLVFDQTFVRAGRFQKAGIGLNFSPSEHVQYGFMLSFINGESAVSTQLYNAWLYTSAIGDSVSADVRGQAFYTDTSNQGFMKHNGAGAAIDLYVQQTFEALQSNWIASAMVMNIGGVQWRPSTERYLVDTTIAFSGLEITDINDIDGQIKSVSIEDSLTGGVRSGYSRGPLNQILPGWMQLEIDQLKAKGFVMGLGLTARIQSLSSAYIHLKPGYRFSEQIGVDMELGYGGFGTFQSGLAVQFQNERLRGQLRVANLEAFIAPKSFGGLTVAGGIQYFFGS